MRLSRRASSGFKARGRHAAEADAIIADASALQEAGCFSIVAEAVPAPVAAELAKLVDVPVIGIGAGPDVDSQVLVLHDLAGLTPDPAPRFVRRYASVRDTLTAAVRAYADDVRARAFPTAEHTYAMADDELRAFRDRSHAP